MNYFIVSKSLDDSSLEYLGGILSSIMDLSEGKIHNLSSDSEAEIAGMKIDIRQCQPKVIISLGAEASRVLDENFKYINSSRGKLSAYNNEGFTTKMVVTYSPKFLLVSDANMEKYGPVFLQDLEYAVKYVKGELVDITKKNLQYAKTYADFKEYFDQYLKDAKLPAYDIETNAKDTRSAAFRIIGYSLAPNSDTGIYVIKESLEYKMSDEDWEKCVNLTKEYISSRKVLVHNIMYERPSTLNEWGVNITNFEDSLIKSRLLLGGKTGAGLKQQCAKNLGYPDWDTDLHVYLTCLGTLRDKLKPTPMGKVREDYIILKEQGFASLLDVYTKKVNLYTETLEKCKGLEPELISKEDKVVLEKGSLDNREGAVKEALETLAELIGNYYDNPAEILELAAKEAINLIDIQHEGIIPYSSVPMNIITKYGALDSIGTQDLNDYLDRRIEKDSTAEVDLHHGYKVLKANYLVGTEMELYGLYWNDEIAENIRVWLSEKAYEAMIAMLQSGFLDDNIFEKSRPHLLQYVKEKEQDKIREILGEFDVMKSGIKLKASGKRITWNQLLDQLGESFIQSHYQQIVEFVKSDLRNKESYPNYEAFTELFNPASNAILGTLQRIFMSVELKVANALNEIINVIKAGLDLESLPNSDRIIYECYLDKVNYNNKIDSGEIEGTKIPAKIIFESMSEVIKQRIISQSQKQSFNRRGKWGKFADKGNSLDKILEDACLKYEIKDTSEPTIVSIYNNLTVMGCDIEDESTWTEQFRFLVNFRTFKKCIKLINVYIDGDKIGRGSVWVVNKQDILDRDKKFAPRKQKYVPDIKEDETYLMQATWGVCFTGDTKIKCLDGISRSFKEIVSQDTKTLWIYAVTPSGNQIPAQATDIRLTRKNAKLVEVELDSNAKIRCTPDHLFMLRNGQYKKAESLTSADELMSVRCGIAIQKFVSHRAVSVVPLDYTEDVYDLTVIGYSNFALDCGVFVHNCTAATLRWRGGVHTLPAGPMVKGIYTSRYKGGVIAAPDYSQQEIRTISGLANCQSLLEAYRNGEDVHMKTAMSVFKKPAEEITKNERRFCKSATFAILYGSTVPGLANLMSVPIEQAQQMMDGFFNAYPELKVWMDARHSEIDRGKKVSCSKVGYFLDIDSNGYGGIEEAYKQAGNYPVQGQSSLIAGYVLNSINQYFVDNHMMTKPISFIHDSLEFDIHPSELFIACQKITSMMNDIPNAEFGIPSKAELTIGISMGDENEVTYLEEQEDGGIIELQGYEDDLDAILKNWRNVYSSVEYTDDPDSIEEVYVPRKEIFMPKLTISKYSGTIRKMVKRRFVIKF